MCTIWQSANKQTKCKESGSVLKVLGSPDKHASTQTIDDKCRYSLPVLLRRKKKEGKKVDEQRKLAKARKREMLKRIRVKPRRLRKN